MENGLNRLMTARRGHFVLESGYHTDLWFNLDALFVQPRSIAPLVTELANRLKTYSPTAICGPMQGGAFLAQALATVLEIDFYFTEPVASTNTARLFAAAYRLPTELEYRLSGERVAIVDDIISAGSSVRATLIALTAARAETVVAGSFLTLGSVGRDYLAGQNIPLETLGHRDFSLWKPEDCPLCQQGTPLELTKC